MVPWGRFYESVTGRNFRRNSRLTKISIASSIFWRGGRVKILKNKFYEIPSSKCFF
jgi:hypothetical protein